MKKIVGLLVGTAFCVGLTGSVARNYTASASDRTGVAQTQGIKEVTTQSEGLTTRAKSAYLMDYSTKTVMYEENALARLPIASMCKIMTLLLSFEAIDNGVLDIDEQIRVSERAASMGGSQVFLEANAEYPVRELLKSIVVCSANDSCVAMAERVAGSESLFVEKMNAKAKELGANDTLFANCTGLPKEPQYSCARDVALMLKALLSHEEYYDFGRVWLDKFAHPKGRYTEITNTNKLVRFYDGCDGGKTGFTNEAGFCLAATAKRGNTRVISVVIGEKSSANRFDDVRTMFDYAFANYTTSPIIEAGAPLQNSVKVQGGKRENLTVSPERSVYFFAKRGEKSDVTLQTSVSKVKAPVKQGERVGELLVFKEGVEIDRIPLLACEGVAKANVWDRLRNIGQKWNVR